MSLEEPDQELFYELETSLHRPDVRTSSRMVADLLADEFVEFGKSGRVYDRQLTIDGLAGERSLLSIPSLQVADFSVSRLSETVVLITYRSIPSNPGTQESLHTLRSSIWKFDTGRW